MKISVVYCIIIWCSISSLFWQLTWGLIFQSLMMAPQEIWWVWQELSQWATEVKFPLLIRKQVIIEGIIPSQYSTWVHLTLTFCVFLVGNVYNIPVCLWLLDTYPYNPPICFVKPTSAMMIKTGKHIDANGKIYLPYLHEWKHVSVTFSFHF